MNISDLIGQLEALQAEYGPDTPVLVHQDYNGSLRKAVAYIDLHADDSYTFPGPTPVEPVTAVIL